MNKVELEFAPGLWMEFTNRDRALEQVEEWAEKSTWRPVVVFGPEGCGKTALLLQASAMLRELGFEVFYLHPLERKFEAEVDLPDLKSEFMRFVERALGENALGRITWTAVDFIRKLQKARRGKIAVIADDVFQAIGLDAAAAYVKALLNLIEYPESRYEKIVVLVATSEGASRREIGRHRWAHLAPMWNMSMEGFRQLYERIPGPKPLFEEVWRWTGGNPDMLRRLYEASWNVDKVVTAVAREKVLSSPFVARWRGWLEQAVENPDALWSPEASEELIDALEEKNLIIYNMYDRDPYFWIDTPPPERDPELGIGKNVAWQTPLHREAVRRALRDAASS
jgi:energy-coupling factor transporter ATP-binding protein EcfA2